jgi:RHS repeat-associated protein
VATFTYSSFGTLVARTGQVSLIYGFTGQETDAESDLRYYDARYYDPRLGRSRLRRPDRLHRPRSPGLGKNTYTLEKFVGSEGLHTIPKIRKTKKVFAVDGHPIVVYAIYLIFSFLYHNH